MGLAPPRKRAADATDRTVLRNDAALALLPKSKLEQAVDYLRNN